MDPAALAWHADDGSFWCGQDELGGYLDSWVQFLDTPSFTVPSSGYTLSAQMEWGIEDPAGADVAGTCTDGWDAANVRISTDGGVSWDLLVGSDPYDFDYGYGWIWNDPEYDCGGDLESVAAGWGGQASWHNVTFDLDDYAGEDVIIRFAFGSDPAYSTPDDASLTGFRVDDIVVSNGTDDLLNCDGSVMCGMTAGCAVWVDQFYDYGDDTRPGGLGWEEYLPGYPFNGNVFLDISDFAGSEVIFKFQSRFDDNDDGGVGGGLFIDDFKIYIDAPAGPPPSGLMAVALDNQVDLSWDDMNVSGTFDYVYDNDSFTNAISLTEGTGFAGTSFEIVGASSVNSVEVYNYEDAVVTTTLAGFGAIGAFFDPNPAYSMEVTIDPGWNTIDVA